MQTDEASLALQDQVFRLYVLGMSFQQITRELKLTSPKHAESLLRAFAKRQNVPAQRESLVLLFARTVAEENYELPPEYAAAAASIARLGLAERQLLAALTRAYGQNKSASDVIDLTTVTMRNRVLKIRSVLETRHLHEAILMYERAALYIQRVFLYQWFGDSYEPEEV